MSLTALSLGAALGAVAANASVKEDTNTAFQRGTNVLAILQPTDGAFVGAAKIQGTNDLDSVADGAAVWTDLLTFTAPAGNSGSKVAMVTAYRRMRVNCTAWTSGAINGLLISGG